MSDSSFLSILDRIRKESLTTREKGHSFEKLMMCFLKTDKKYADDFKDIWLWNDFPYRGELGGKDIGIDLVALTYENEYWAIQCKCYQENAYIDKSEIDTFLASSGRTFIDGNGKRKSFSHRLWISTTNNWSANAEETIKNQNISFSRLELQELIGAPVDWNKIEKGMYGDEARKPQKKLRDHQLNALNYTNEYFKKHDRGKLIMACGTGKTFTSLKIAEKETNGKGLILFLVPSIALLGQALNEWYHESSEKINAICICSDEKIAQKKNKEQDGEFNATIELAKPASTNIDTIVKQFNSFAKNTSNGMTVVFSTYQSINVVSEAQKEIINQNKTNDENCGIFDLIICDEAHRTTGYTFKGEKESTFVKVHNDDFIKAKKRLYMTATPRLYRDDVKEEAKESETILCSMDDIDLYGEEIYRIGFGEAVKQGLLSDYKVVVLAMNEGDVSKKLLDNMCAVYEGTQIDADDVARLIGCINALSKNIIGDNNSIKKADPEPMKMAVAFCQSIDAAKKITEMFNNLNNQYPKIQPNVEEKLINVSVDHINGTMNAPKRNGLLQWLNEAKKENNKCHILTNVKCLSEGVDVPSLDAVLFLSAKNSEIDVVQSVGRVMRKAPGKKYGYIIIPIIVPSDVEPEKALDNDKNYKVVWTVLNALRAHDDRFNATVNKIELNKEKPDNIIVGRPGSETNETQDEEQRTYEYTDEKLDQLAKQLSFEFADLQKSIYGKIVQKVGDRKYWEQWAGDVAEIAQKHIERINKLIDEDIEHQKTFDDFLAGLRKNINPAVDKDEAVEMLAQHIITKPVFEALFQNFSFASQNPVSVAMQNILEKLEQNTEHQDISSLDKFYDSVKNRVKDIDNAEARQKIIIELYDKFFKTAFPKVVEKLGIVYTPVEIVDFIINSVDDLLKSELNCSLSSDKVHILDPFTGTGTFITRLLQSGRIEQKDLIRKYTHEIHANEIVLLAYYIASINIENVFHDIIGTDESYRSFEGICLTDTFQLNESDIDAKLFAPSMPENSDRVIAQKKAPVRVIIGNPPYSVGQRSANDNAQNQKYEKLDARIAKLYAERTNATNKNSLYDSYIKAFRWASDRIDKQTGGIIGFVSNGGWLEGNAMDGFRKSLAEEFSEIYVFNLRGNCRTQGEMRRKEAGSVFGSGSRTPIAITLLVKKPDYKGKAKLHYFDIGDYLSREEKLKIIANSVSVHNPNINWETLTPDEHGDWLNQRNDVFGSFIPMGDKDNKKANTIFVPYYSNGVKTNRDSWVYNSSVNMLSKNIVSMIDFYNIQVKMIKDGNEFSLDSMKISWDTILKNEAEKGHIIKFDKNKIIKSIYRPFFKQNLYFDRACNNSPALLPKLFPTAAQKNLVICVSGVGVTKPFSAIITDYLPDLELIGKSQCFPLYYYEKREARQGELFGDDSNDYIRHDGISDFILDRCRKSYGDNVGKEDIFYFVYGFLHSPEYREQFANDLKKMLPRIPFPDGAEDFWAFSSAGRKLGALHVNYESVAPNSDVIVEGDKVGNFRVRKMRFPSQQRERGKEIDKDTIIYNDYITIKNIPSKAYEYIVNGKSAIEWIMERYQITTDKDSGITNDPNDWCDEVGNPRYILDLLLSVIQLSIDTVDIVNGLPSLNLVK